MALTATEIRERDRRSRSARTTSSRLRRSELGIDLQVALEDVEKAARALRLFVRDEVMPELGVAR